MKITLAQTAPKLNRSNLQEVIALINQYKNSSDMIVFPELSLSGYMLQDKLCEDAWSVDELEVLTTLSQDITIVVGAAMREGNVFRNTALCFDGGKLQSQHIKVHLPNYGMFEEARYFEGGERFEAFWLDGKRVVMLVCEDVWHADVHKEIVALDPDIITVLAASPARGFYDDGLVIEDKWYTIIKTLSKESSSKLIFVNRVGFEDGLGFWGGSCIVENGDITHRLEEFEKQIQTFEVEI